MDLLLHELMRRRNEVDFAHVMSPGEYLSRHDAWMRVDSECLHSVAFFETAAGRGVLGLRFKDKKTGGVKSTYRYQDVPTAVVGELLHAPSHGTFFHARIREKYSYAQM